MRSTARFPSLRRSAQNAEREAFPHVFLTQRPPLARDRGRQTRGAPTALGKSMATVHARTGYTRALDAANAAPLVLSPDTIAATCGLAPHELALLAGLAPDLADREPWHPKLQALLCDLVELFDEARAAHPHETGTAFWAAHRAVRSLGGRTLVEAVADGDWDAVNAQLHS
jgi:hypothetical protein